MQRPRRPRARDNRCRTWSRARSRRRAMAVDFELELVWIPVSDVDRAKRFYLEQAGFDLLVDIPDGLPGQRIVQVTPPGSACSIGFGAGVTPAKPGSQQGLFVV